MSESGINIERLYELQKGLENLDVAFFIKNIKPGNPFNYAAICLGYEGSEFWRNDLHLQLLEFYGIDENIYDFLFSPTWEAYLENREQDFQQTVERLRYLIRHGEPPKERNYKNKFYNLKPINNLLESLNISEI